MILGVARARDEAELIRDVHIAFRVCGPGRVADVVLQDEDWNCLAQRAIVNIDWPYSSVVVEIPRTQKILDGPESLRREIQVFSECVLRLVNVVIGAHRRGKL